MWLDLHDEQQLPIVWNTDPFYVKKSKIKETRKTLEALKDIFNDGDFSFWFELDERIGRVKIGGEGYEFSLSDEFYDEFDADEEIDGKKVFEQFYDDDYAEIKDKLIEIWNKLLDMDGENDSIFLGDVVCGYLNVDTEKSKGARWYNNDPINRIWSFHLVRQEED